MCRQGSLVEGSQKLSCNALFSLWSGKTEKKKRERDYKEEEKQVREKD